MSVRARVLALSLAFIAGAGALALVALVAGLWSQSAPVILNTLRVESSIEASIRAQRHLSSSVSCPVNIVQQSGVVFNCVATVHHHQFRVVVTETNDDGHVVYVVT